MYQKKQPKQQPSASKVCTVEGCPSVTTRMDVHLVRKHKMVKGSEGFKLKMVQATLYEEPETEKEVNLIDEEIKDYW